MDTRPGLIHVGCGEITWGPTPEDQVLPDIARAGYEGAVPKLTPGRSATGTVEEYAGYGLVPAPPYLGAPFWDPAQTEPIIARAEAAARFAHGIGCTELYVAAHGDYRAPSGRKRREVAGHVGPGDAMTDAQWQTLTATLDRVGEATLRHGVRACFHNHAGTVVETEEECERLLSGTDPERLFLGPDTGHLAWAGGDVAEFFRRHVDRIRTAHLKDIDGAVRDLGREAGWTYSDFSKNGIFRELGDGDVDLVGAVEALRTVSFTGWLIVETDVTQLPTPLESAQRSRTYLRELGL